MEIRKAKAEDVAAINLIYADARDYMRQSGNMKQWQGNYPDTDTINKDISEKNLYLCYEQNEILGVFYFKIGDDPTYIKIYDGKWLNSEPYGVIHRIAVSKNSHSKGVARFCFDYCFNIIPNIKIDTHEDNLPMQKSLSNNGFTYCGVIHLENGGERWAYQKGI